MAALRRSTRWWCLVSLAGAPACAPTTPPPVPASHADTAGDARGVEAFNQAMRDATLRMDTPALIALWEDDGVSLLPGEKPIVGKKAVGAFIETAINSMPGAKMKSFEMACTGLLVSGDWASEMCDEHQVVDLGEGKPPFDGRGKLLFVLHRGADGAWRIQREMWNQGAKPQGS
jgi:ketosteroid isomerase-like protein